MDNSEEENPQQMQSSLHALQNWWSHPIAEEVKRNLEEQKSGLLSGILHVQPNSIQDFVNHFQAIGVYNGLNQLKASVEGSIENLKERLKDHGLS